MKYLAAAILTTSFLFLASSVNASEDWVINDFQSNIKVQRDGNVRVAETISVDFGSLQKHGIYRDIPYIYQLSGGDKYYTKVDVTSVTANGYSVPYERTEEGGYVRIQIGDPDKTVSGKQTYSLEYVAAGVLRSYESYDELYWNVTGDRSPVPIKNATASVTLPSSDISRITCYEGPSGSKQSCKSSEEGKNRANFQASRSLEKGEQLTVVVGYTKGLVPIVTVLPPKSVFDNLFSLVNFVAFVIACFVGIGAAFYLWWKAGRDLWWKRRFLYDPQATAGTRPVGAHDQIVVEYDPPEKLRPAEIGTLIDERADTVDVTATIIDLAARGYLKIAEEAKSWLFGSTDYVLTKIEKDDSSLLPYEKELLDRLFDEGTIVKVSSLKTKFYKDLAEVKKKLYQDMGDKKFFYEDPEKVRRKYLFFAIGMVLVGVSFVVAGGASIISLLVAIGAGIVVGGAALLIFSQAMPRKTADGHEMWRRVKGYELFISKAERYRQQFFERKNMFNEILPYAIVFGVTEKFAQAFKDMGIEPPQPAWYTGTTPFNAVVFAVNMNSFSSSLSSAMAAAPGGSGFSGGGGFAGGGFGGGGVGSW